MTIKLFLFFLISFLLFSCKGKPDTSGTDEAPNNKTKSIPAINYAYSNAYPHDTNSFIEGFLVHNGKLYESTGATNDLPQTRSLFGVVDLKTGIIDTKVELDKTNYFGEGIAFLNGKIFQLTYKTKVGFIYDATTFKKLGNFTFPSNEGWGLTTNGTDLIMSDGTNKLVYLDPNTFQVLKTISVTENGYAKTYLNELEYITGYIYANIWNTNTIAKIDPTDGTVVGTLDLGSLAYEAKNIYPGSLEMNGIAYDSLTNNIYVTGKLWPKIYEIKFNH
jgi:glutamine cyclotransferase